MLLKEAQNLYKKSEIQREAKKKEEKNLLDQKNKKEFLEGKKYFKKVRRKEINKYILEAIKEGDSEAYDRFHDDSSFDSGQLAEAKKYYESKGYKVEITYGDFYEVPMRFLNISGWKK